MKTEIKESLRVGQRVFSAPVMVYSSIEEAKTAAGGEENLLRRLNGFLHAHGTAADLRDLIREIVEEVSKVKPTETPTGKKNAKGEPITKLEDAQPYVARVLTKSPELFDTAQKLLDQRAKGYTRDGEQIPPLQVDASFRPPAQRGPKKLAQKWKEIALSFLRGDINPVTKKPRDIANLNKACKAVGLGGFVLSAEEAKNKLDEKVVERLGWLCKAYQDSRDALEGM
jgi:hypothetical protein